MVGLVDEVAQATALDHWVPVQFLDGRFLTGRRGRCCSCRCGDLLGRHRIGLLGCELGAGDRDLALALAAAVEAGYADGGDADSHCDMRRELRHPQEEMRARVWCCRGSTCWSVPMSVRFKEHC